MRRTGKKRKRKRKRRKKRRKMKVFFKKKIKNKLFESPPLSYIRSPSKRRLLR